MKPLLLRHDNFTPPARTPWGGRRIREHYKAGLPLPAGDGAGPGAVVGESWEISIEPSFPSRAAGDGASLAEIIAAAPAAWLGEAVAARWGGNLPILVKLLDAADNLSVQVHPGDADPALAVDESGKPESWVVLHAEAGAGLYLGFREGVRREDVARCLTAAGPLDQLMQFVPVASGDVFVIAAGTPHAIGAGLTLVEPQLVQPGRKGVTYRFWDWNRRYGPGGNPDPQGQPRPLHVARSLAVTRWEGPRGEAFVASCRPASTVLSQGPVRREQVVDWRWFVVERWQGSGGLSLPETGTLWGLCCARGAATVRTGGGSLTLRMGQSAVVPAAAGAFAIDARDALIVATRPRA